ncbi:hypothetical protein SEUCBS139899_002711 [Sporothrix eucalyptigena]|uniref:Mid2 domain-containing protein n=1 Tax=Sporothrix eucalyptigena TaxID=1812306 RepID=A0ABP0BB47_9PEZI
MLDATIPSRSAGRRSTPSLLAVAFLAVSALPQLALANANAPCYDPSGAVAPGYYPCDPTAYITNCCADGWTCFSNSLCVVTQESAAFPNLTTGAVERAMCTNPEWNNQICGDFCVTGSDNADGAMVACGDDHFCCLGDYNAGLCNCSLSSANSGGSFVVNDGKAQTIVGETASFTGTVSYLTSQPTPSQTTSGSPSSSGSSTSSATGTSSSGTGTKATGTGTATSTSNNNSKHTLALGLGVGLGVGIPLLAIAGFLYYWFGPRRNNQGSGGYGGRRSLPTDLALDGTAFGEQMAMQGNAYRRGETGAGVVGGGANGGLSNHRLDLNDLGEVPPPPPQVRSNVG